MRGSILSFSDCGDNIGRVLDRMSSKRKKKNSIGMDLQHYPGPAGLTVPLALVGQIWHARYSGLHISV